MATRQLAEARALHQVPDRPTNSTVLHSCTLLNPLSEAEKTLLANNSYMAYVERGELVWMAGEPAEYVAIVGAGFIKMTKTNHNGHEVALELLGPGQCFGLMAAIEGRALPLNAVAVTNAWYLKIPTRVFMPIYSDSMKLKDSVVRTIGPRLRKAHDMMSRLSSGRAEERIAAVLFILADSYGEEIDEGIRLSVPLTRQDISEMAGTTVETAIRVLSRWQKEGIVETDRQVITIHNEQALLESIAG